MKTNSPVPEVTHHICRHGIIFFPDKKTRIYEEKNIQI